jgi:hypothetical protein
MYVDISWPVSANLGAPAPPQGRWCIYGLGLPEDILRKIYYENAARLLGIKLKVKRYRH